MKRLIIVLLAVLCLAGVAQGVTTVYEGITQITGTSASFVNGLTSAGDTIVVNAGSADIIEVKRIDFKPDADTTGTTNIQLGSNIYSIQNALADNVYGKNLGSDFNAGAPGDDLVINGPAAVRYNIDYRVR